MEESKRENPIKFYFLVYEIGLPEVDKVMGDYEYDDLVESDDDSIERRLFIEDETYTEDRISKLPDDALQFIISSLPMREGAATSILSRRWRNLWSGSVTHLHFNDSNVFGHDFTPDFIEVKEKETRMQERRKRNASRVFLRLRVKKKGVIENERTRFIDRVNQILKLRSASRMDKFLVRFPLVRESASHINRWMKLAALQGVTRLDLDFNWTNFYLRFNPRNRYNFPVQRFGSSLNYLHIRFCILDFPPCFQGLNSLVSLNLYDSFLITSSVQNILSNCPSLEWLSLSDCDFPDPTILEFVGLSVPIKHLRISDCKNIKEIKLWDVNVLSLELKMLFENVEKLSIKNAPHLSRLVLHAEDPVEISGNVPSLETLFIKREYSELPKLSAFNNLKRLVFSVEEYMSNLFEVVCLLEICPLLQQLELDMGTFEGRYSTDRTKKVTDIPGCPHSNLSEVVIHAFENYPKQIELAKYLLKNAIVLKKMKIYTTCKTYDSNGVWRLSRNGKLVGAARKEVYELLKKEARPSTKLLFRST